MLTNVAFTDPQGQTFTDAVVKARSVRRNRNWHGSENDSIHLESNDLFGEYQANSNRYEDDNLTISVDYYYWPTQTAYDEQRKPYMLSRNNTDDVFVSFEITENQLADEKYAGLSLEEIADLYFTDTVLPTLV